jgi:hypothetical protein
MLCAVAAVVLLFACIGDMLQQSPQPVAAFHNFFIQIRDIHNMCWCYFGSVITKSDITHGGMMIYHDGGFLSCNGCSGHVGFPSIWSIWWQRCWHPQLCNL